MTTFAHNRDRLFLWVGETEVDERCWTADNDNHSRSDTKMVWHHNCSDGRQCSMFELHEDGPHCANCGDLIRSDEWPG